MRTALVLLGFVLAAGCQKESAVSPVTPIAPPANTGAVQQGANAQGEEGCVNQWLKAHHLDEFGNAEGTMYAGGTPLFDETSGTTKDRLTYVYERQPEAKAACRK